ncbi:MAG: tetratricopeptide repeat protein [Terriglobia bacterium]
MSCNKHRLRLALVAAILAASTWCHCRASARAASRDAAAATLSTAESTAVGATATQLFDQASALIKAGRYSDSIPLLQRAEAMAPGTASIHHYLGYALWKLNRWEAAKTEFEKARRLDPQNPYTCYFLARIAQSLGHSDQSIADYEEILKLGPAIYDTHQRLGQAYLDKGEIQKARTQIAAALTAQPWNGSLYYQMGRIDQKERRLAQSRAEFAAAERLKRVDHASIQRLLQLFQAVQKHDTRQVGNLRSEILSQSSQDPEILDSTGYLLGKGGFYSEALDPLERAATLAPDSFESNYNLGFTLLKLGRNREAETWLAKALAIQPDSPEVNKLLAVLYVDEGRNTEAIARLQALTQASPADPHILALLGEQYLAGHYVKSAIPCLLKTIDLSPDDPAARYLLIEAYEEEFDYPNALRAAQGAARRFPQSARAVYEVGQQYANLGDYKSARPYAEKAIQMDASLVQAYNLLGDIESKSGEFQSALETFEKAQRLDPKDVLALRGIADNLIRLRRYADALVELKQAITIRPEDSDLYLNLMKVYARLGQRENAAQAESTFQQLHAREIVRRNAQAPRNFGPSTPGGGKS